MGGCASAPPVDPVLLAHSKEIDNELQQHSRREAKKVNLLLLGAGESGKSTVFKQFKLLYRPEGITAQEREAFRTVVFSNTVSQMKLLIQSAQRSALPFTSDGTAAAALLMDLPSSGDVWNASVAQLIKTLWKESAILNAYEQRCYPVQINDSAKYFFDNVSRFGEGGYVPTDDDVLRARMRTTGVDETEFTFKDVVFHITDVGGQRSERRKWIHCFEGVKVVIFCVALSEFDQRLREDDTQNRMKESLLLFEEMTNSVWFRNTCFVLFLNKEDLFREKIARVDLRVCFPTYTGGCNYDAALQFLRDRFLEINQAPHPVYPHVTCAVSRENVAFVWTKVTEVLLKEVLSEVF